ncbi:MAG: hypothetical protein ACOX52_13935 [Verrucomicrobiota bacterium]
MNSVVSVAKSFEKARSITRPFDTDADSDPDPELASPLTFSDGLWLKEESLSVNSVVSVAQSSKRRVPSRVPSIPRPIATPSFSDGLQPGRKRHRALCGRPSGSGWESPVGKAATFSGDH